MILLRFIFVEKWETAHQIVKKNRSLFFNVNFYKNKLYININISILKRTYILGYGYLRVFFFQLTYLLIVLHSTCVMFVIKVNKMKHHFEKKI